MKDKGQRGLGIWTYVHQRIADWGILLFLCQAVSGIWRKIWNRALARRLGIKRLSILRGSYIQGIEYFHIGENFIAGQGLWLEAIAKSDGQNLSPKIVIGKNMTISSWSHIAALELIEIGDNVMIGSKVLITDHNHGSYGPEIHDAPDTAPFNRPLVSGPVAIGNNVWIGDGVVIMPNTTIGNGCVIGANAVVQGLILPNTIAVGCPARPVKTFDSNSNQWVRVK